MDLEFLNHLPLACNITSNQIRNWSFERWEKGHSTIDFDTCVFKPFVDASFWITGAAIIINATGCNLRLKLFKQFRQDYLTDNANSALPTSRTGSRGKAQAPSWGPPCLTPRFCIALEIMICFLFSAIISYEGGAVLLTAWRFTIVFIQLSFPDWEPRALAVFGFIPISIFILLAWAGMLFVGYHLVKIQSCMVKELVNFYRENPWKKKNNDVELGELDDNNRPPVYERSGQAEVQVL